VSTFRTMSESAGKLASDLPSGTPTDKEALRQMAEMLREALRLMDRLDSDMQHLRCLCRR
jgi:hypothetical protein